MEISVAHSPSVSSSNSTLLVALELSKATWLVALSAPLSDRIRHHSIAGGDAAALLKLIGQARSRAEDLTVNALNSDALAEVFLLSGPRSPTLRPPIGRLLAEDQRLVDNVADDEAAQRRLLSNTVPISNCCFVVAGQQLGVLVMHG
jgi:hypothetical protein